MITQAVTWLDVLGNNWNRIWPKWAAYMIITTVISIVAHQWTDGHWGFILLVAVMLGLSAATDWHRWYWKAPTLLGIGVFLLWNFLWIAALLFIIFACEIIFEHTAPRNLKPWPGGLTGYNRFKLSPLSYYRRLPHQCPSCSAYGYIQYGDLSGELTVGRDFEDIGRALYCSSCCSAFVPTKLWKTDPS